MLGLDIGHCAVKAVVLRCRGTRVDCVAAGRVEGLSEDEIANWPGELTEWLRRNGWSKLETTAGTPQYLATVQHATFPRSSPATLKDMVAFETQHLAGLSEHAFVSDFTFASEKSAETIPVLIAMCRESVAMEQINRLENAGVTVADLALTGPALAAAFLRLYPQGPRIPDLKMVVDIGGETTTIAVVLRDRLVYSSAVMFGANAFKKTVGDRPGAAAGTSDPEIGVSQEAAASLVDEIRGSLENGLAAMGTMVASQPVSLLALCGGGARIPGLKGYLEKAFGCPATVLGVTTPKSGEPDPTLVTAFGLALHGLGQSSFPLSMAPRFLKQRTRRRRRFPWLMAASALFLAFLTTVEVNTYKRLKTGMRELDHQLRELEQCQALIPRLEAARKAVDKKHLTMVSIIAKANRQHRYIDTINQLAKAQKALQRTKTEDESWIVYLADNDRFEARQSLNLSAGAAADPAPAAPSLWKTSRSPDNDTVPSALLPQKISDIQPLDYMVAGLLAKTDRENIFRLVKPMVQSLTRAGSQAEDSGYLFANVDLMSPGEATDLADIFSPWSDAATPEASAARRLFILKLSFASRDIKTSMLEIDDGGNE